MTIARRRHSLLIHRAGRFALLSVAFTAWAAGADIIAPASADTFITEHPGLGGPTSNHGSDTALSAIGSSGFEAYPMVQFDLVPYSGDTVYGQPTLTFYVGATTGEVPITQDFQLYLSIPWSENIVTWDSFGGAPIPLLNVGTVLSDTGPITLGVGSLLTVDVPASIVQYFIDSPNGEGLLLYSTITADGHDIAVTSRESGEAPTLNFSTSPVEPDVPEPATLWLCAAGIVWMGVFGRAILSGRLSTLCAGFRQHDQYGLQRRGITLSGGKF